MEGRAGPDVFGDQIGVLAHAIAGTLDLNDDSVMEQPVEQRGGDDGIAEHVAHSAKPRFEVKIMAPFS